MRAEDAAGLSEWVPGRRTWRPMHDHVIASRALHAGVGIIRVVFLRRMWSRWMIPPWKSGDWGYSSSGSSFSSRRSARLESFVSGSELSHVPRKKWSTLRLISAHPFGWLPRPTLSIIVMDFTPFKSRTIITSMLNLAQSCTFLLQDVTLEVRSCSIFFKDDESRVFTEVHHYLWSPSSLKLQPCIGWSRARLVFKTHGSFEVVVLLILLSSLNIFKDEWIRSNHWGYEPHVHNLLRLDNTFHVICSL